MYSVRVALGRNLEFTEWWRLEEVSGNSGPTFLLKVELEPCLGSCAVMLWTSLRMETMQPHWAAPMRLHSQKVIVVNITYCMFSKLYRKLRQYWFLPHNHTLHTFLTLGSDANCWCDVPCYISTQNFMPVEKCSTS